MMSGRLQYTTAEPLLRLLNDVRQTAVHNSWATVKVA